MTRFILQSYRNSIGDLGEPDVGAWIDKGYSEAEQKTIAYLAWGAWFLSTGLNVIILLNFLIAVIS